jgi:nucleoid-associated protein YgaU
MSRFMARNYLINTNELYKEYLKERGVKQIQQYESPIFFYPSQDDLKKISTVTHIWSSGDRLAKLASEYYGNPKDWWIIARFNQIGSEANLKLGDVIRIPTDKTQLEYVFRG